MFIGSCNGIFRALERQTGEVLWATPVGPGSGQYFFHGDPLITADAVIVGADATTGGAIHAFERAIGRERWRFSAGSGVRGAIVGLGRRAFATTPQGEVVSVDIDSGELLWSRPLKAPGWEGPGAAGNRVFVGTVGGSVSALNAETGREEWRVSLGAAISTSVSASDVALYVGAENGVVYRVDPQKGTILSSAKVDEHLRPRGTPVRARDSVVVLLADEKSDYRALVSLDPNLNNVRWRQTAPQPWTTSRVFVWHDLVVVGAPGGQVVAHCLADGSLAWSRTVGGTIRAIGGAGDTLYVGATQGVLSALRVPSACTPAK